MSASFRSIVQQVTQEKLEELKIQKDLMTNHFNPVLEQVSVPTINPVDALQILLEAIKDSPVKDIIDATLIENLKYVLENEKDDPSIGSQLVLSWIDKMKQEIQFALRKCQYSYLYGSLLSEWLELGERKRAKSSSPAESDGTNEQPEIADKLTSNKVEAIDNIKALMFNELSPDEYDSEKFRKFLSDELFNFKEKVEGQNVMKSIRKETEDYFKVENCVITAYNVQSCIQGLRSDDLLSLEKKAALKELSENPEALEEVASLLTNRLRNLSRWEWPSSCKLVKMRRGLAGEFKPYMDEDIITALFLQYVGVQWASYFKRQFFALYRSNVWTRKHCFDTSIEWKRNQFHESTFLSCLPDCMATQSNKHQDEYAKIEASDVVYAPQSASMVMGQMQGPPPPPPVFGSASQSTQCFSSQAFSTQAFSTQAVPNQNTGGLFGCVATMNRPAPFPRQPPQNIKPPSLIDFKQSFLHTLQTEIRLNQVIRPDNPLIVVQADIEAFGPSIIHDAVLTVLEYLGVPAQWIVFFKKFLQPNVCFRDGETLKPVVRGVPTSHVLSSLFGEALMFLLDFHVNQKCNGMRIYRIADEFWFWSDNAENVTKAWETMNTYGKMVGLKIKENRSGSVSVYSDDMLSKMKGSNKPVVCGPMPLPQKSIHWGYLELYSNGIFTIDRKAITKFLLEMQGLLDKSECVLEWINIFNKYVAFFVRNFGKSAIVSGKQHLDQIISALQMIYTGLFGSENGSPVDKLKDRFDKLRTADIVDAWAYWPLEKGGLGLINPFIGVMSLRAAYIEINDDDHFRKLLLKDKDVYEENKKAHERNYGKNTHGIQFGMIPTPVSTKLETWPEFLATRETKLVYWYTRYIDLLERPSPKSPSVSDRFWILDSSVTEGELERNYMMWLFTYYETQLVLHFGSAKFINSKLLPMSMIANIQKTKVQH